MKPLLIFEPEIGGYLQVNNYYFLFPAGWERQKALAFMCWLNKTKHYKLTDDIDFDQLCFEYETELMLCELGIFYTSKHSFLFSPLRLIRKGVLFFKKYGRKITK